MRWADVIVWFPDTMEAPPEPVRRWFCSRRCPSLRSASICACVLHVFFDNNEPVDDVRLQISRFSYSDFAATCDCAVYAGAGGGSIGAAVTSALAHVHAPTTPKIASAATRIAPP
jgi:hypothetical protein